MIVSLEEKYKGEVFQKIQNELDVKNVYNVPKLEKVSVNIGLGEAVQNPKVIDEVVSQISDIVGQKPIITRAKKSIAGFKLREGMQIGCSVTLRRKNMWNFLDRLVHVSLPRVRDFRGISPKAFDGKGNYNLGLKEQLIFPEIDFDQIDKVRGMNISIVTNTNSDEQSFLLLKELGFPFRK
jgi:large subunit ribosomal protein L5